jgi:hypothetical protein
VCVCLCVACVCGVCVSVCVVCVWCVYVWREGSGPGCDPLIRNITK